MLTQPHQINKRNILDARGHLSEIVRETVDGHIAQVYVTSCYPGVVKGWHLHRFQTDRMFCVSGVARIVVAQEDVNEDELSEVEFTEYVIGPLSPGLVVIPPNTYHAFTACGNEPCLIINCPDREYDGTDEFRKPTDWFDFDWWDVSR